MDEHYTSKDAIQKLLEKQAQDITNQQMRQQKQMEKTYQDMLDQQKKEIVRLRQEMQSMKQLMENK